MKHFQGVMINDHKIAISLSDYLILIVTLCIRNYEISFKQLEPLLQPLSWLCQMRWLLHCAWNHTQSQWLYAHVLWPEQPPYRRQRQRERRWFLRPNATKMAAGLADPRLTSTSTCRALKPHLLQNQTKRLSLIDFSPERGPDILHVSLTFKMLPLT